MNNVIDVFGVVGADNLCLEGCASALSQAETVNSAGVVMGGAVVGGAVARVCDRIIQILILLPGGIRPVYC